MMMTSIDDAGAMRKGRGLVLSMLAVGLLIGCSPPDKSKPATAPPTAGSDSGAAQQPKSKAFLNMATPSVAPGGTVEGVITITLEQGWHTYGDPPGDSGMPPGIEFTLPEGWKSEVLPLPPAKEFPDALGTANGYEDKLTITFRLTAPPEATVGSTVDVSINLQWLICKETCIPMSETLQTSVAIEKK